MNHLKKQAGYSARLKYLLALPVIIGLLCISSHAFAQNQSPPTPPPPPPSPDELFKKINPFKKHKKDTAANKQVDTAKSQVASAASAASQATQTQTTQTQATTQTPATQTKTTQPQQGPPSRPNPLNLFKKKKRDTTKTGN